MQIKGILRVVLILFVLSINIGCDQVSKSIVRHKMTDYTYISFLNNHVTLNKVENSGAFLSLGDSLSKPAKIILLNIIPLLAIAFGLFFILTRTNVKGVTLIALIMILGGGVGNLYDRIVHGSVTDFMHINFGLFQTGVFNVADLSITFGVFILIIFTSFKKRDTIEPVGDQA
jgi:signal peptidase II